MRPIRTPYSNCTYKGSEGVEDLPCQRMGPGIVVSIWQLTEEERANVASGANIALVIHTEPIPPMGMAVVFEDELEDKDGR